MEDDAAAAEPVAAKAVADPDQGELAKAEGKKPSKKRLIITAVVGLIIMVGMFELLLPQFGSYAEAFEKLADMPLVWVVGLVVACLLNIFLYPLTVLVSVTGLKYWHGFVERQVGFLISNSIPGGGAFAVGAQYRVLSLYRVPPAVSASAVSADAVWTFLLTLGMPAIGVGLLVIEGRSTAGLITIAVVGMVAFIIILAGSIVVIRSEDGARRVGRFGQKLINPIFKKLKKDPPKLEAALVKFRYHAHDLVVTRWRKLTLTNVIAQLTPYLILVCAIGGLGEFPGSLTLVEIFAAYSVALLLVSFPITPGGLGTVDAALVALLTAFGCPGDVAVAADLTWRLVWFLPQIIVGAITMVVYLLGSHRQTAVLTT